MLILMLKPEVLTIMQIAKTVQEVHEQNKVEIVRPHTHTLATHLPTKALEKEVAKIEVSAGFCTVSIHWIL